MEESSSDIPAPPLARRLCLHFPVLFPAIHLSNTAVSAGHLPATSPPGDAPQILDASPGAVDAPWGSTAETIWVASGLFQMAGARGSLWLLQEV